VYFVKNAVVYFLLGCFLLFFYFLWHLYITYFYTIRMADLGIAINKFTSDATRSLKDPLGTAKSVPALFVNFMANAGLFVVIVLLAIWLVTGWRLSIGLVKSGLKVSRFTDGGGGGGGGMPGNFGGDIGLFDGSGLQRRAAQSDIVGLGWDLETRSHFSTLDNRPNGFQDNYDKDLGPAARYHKSSFGTREPPIFQEVSVDTLRTEDQEREAVAALAKINSERVRRRPEMEYDPLPWAPFWNDWKKEKTDVYNSFTDGPVTSSQAALLGPSMVNSPGFFRG